MFEEAAMTGADEDQPDEAATFEVMAEENSHHGEDAYLSESFTSAAYGPQSSLENPRVPL